MSNTENGGVPPAITVAATERRARLGFAFALSCLGVIGVASYFSVARLNAHAVGIEHSYQILSGIEALLTAVTDAEIAERGYVITGDEVYLAPYRQSAQTVDRQTRMLRELTADNRAQQQRLDSVEPLLASRLADLRAVIELRKNQGFGAAQREILTGKGKQLRDRIRGLIDQMRATEQSLLEDRERLALRSLRVALAVVIVGCFCACALVGLAFIAIRQGFAGKTRAERALHSVTGQFEARVGERTAQLAQIASIVEGSDDAIISKNLDGVITSWNVGAERLFGYAAPEVIGQPMTLLIPLERSTEEPIILARIARGETTDHFETTRIGKGGRKIDVSVTISPIRDAQGRIIGASKIARDITERNLAQAKLQAQLGRLSLLQQITRSIGERQDLRSIFQVVIRTLETQMPLDFCCICLYEPVENELTVTCVGSHSAALAMELAMSEQARIAIDENGLAQCVRRRLVYEPDMTEVPFPFAQRLAGGGLRAMVAAPLVVESKVFGVLIAARLQVGSFSGGECDFLKQSSEHVALAVHQTQLYHALQQAYDDLRQTQQAVMQQERLLALGQMASGIAHDINNAISPIALYTESLLEKEPDLSPRTRNYLETIQRAIDDVAQTVARMREFYRQRESQMTLLPVDVNCLVRQVVDLTRARWNDMAQQRGVAIEMRTELAPNLPAIMGAEHEIRDALTNLIFNAVDAMPNGGPLTLRTTLRPERGDQSAEPAIAKIVQIEVIDTGVGMDEDTRRRCLEPFFTTKGERGTGLGLAMVYGMMQRHSADIEIDSELGKGTAVRLAFTVPNVPTVGAAALPSAIAVPPLRILVVDDDPMVLKSLRDALELDGHRVTTADGGQAGIDAFLAAQAQGNPFPVVITDLGMPYVDGRKVSADVKTAAPGTIVLMLTGWGQRLIADGDIPTHVDHVLSKPPKLRQLREALAHCLKSRSS